MGDMVHSFYLSFTQGCVELFFWSIQVYLLRIVCKKSILLDPHINIV